MSRGDEPAGDATGREPSTEELRALATHARERLTLYRRKILLGDGDPRRFAELKRVSEGAADRLRRARERTGPTP